MNIAIVGFGLQGRSVYEFYKSNNNITICDQSMPEDVPKDVHLQIGDQYLRDLDRFELIFRSPKVHPEDIIKANSREITSKITTNTNEFLRLCPTKNIIGVTGTKGKGTTSTLIAKLLEASGFRVHLGGNIGIPPLDLLREEIRAEDYVVLELANFQLIDLKYSPHIGVCLLIEPEHLDWHADLDEYYRSKTQLFRNQTSEDMAIYFGLNENSRRIASTGGAKLIPYYKAPGALPAGNHITIDGIPIIRISEIKLLGSHNLQNICAALTVLWQIKPDPEVCARVLREFKGLPFRIEFRKEVRGVKYYNDSFSSAPTSTIAAIDAVKGPKVLIVGGKDRGLDLSPLITKIKESESIKKVILIGEAKDRIKTELEKIGFNNFEILNDVNMEDIVNKINSMVSDKDNVILSPGFPSFDMFKNFEDRGIKFNEAVEKL